jgi:enterobacterial common antigen flippase
MPTLVAENSSDARVVTTDRIDHAGKGTYGEILKSSALVGGSQVLNIVIGMVRTKAMAVLLGPSGFGLFGLYSSVATLAQTVSGLGVNSSGVRQIAAAASSEDQETIQRTVFVLRRISLLLGMLGAGLMVLFSRQISVITFASESHAAAVSWLAVAVFLTLVSARQTALIQGFRRILELAKIQVLGALFGTLTSIPLVYYFRERGVVPSLICVAAMTIASSWWYSRRLEFRPLAYAPMSPAQFWMETAALLKLGMAFMASSLITLGVAYAVRVMVLHRVGIEATGLYQSAWTLGGLYVGFILQAMGADFYPRLTASAHHNPTCNRLVNEQAQVGLLLAGPGVVATLTLAPLVIALFYSAKFGPAVGLLRWICLGTTLQVISWPMGFVIVAKAKRGLFFGCELAWGLVSMLLAWGLVHNFGLQGAGIAYFGSYVFHALMLYVIVSRLSGFRCSRENQTTGMLSLALVAITFCGFQFLPFYYAVGLGICATVLHTVYSVRKLTSLVSPEQIPSPIRRALNALGLLPRTHIPTSEAS